MYSFVYVAMFVVLSAGVWIGYNYRDEIYELLHKKEIEEKRRKREVANKKRKATILKKKGLYDKAKTINEK